jgi:hypothetical protein
MTVDLVAQNFTSRVELVSLKGNFYICAFIGNDTALQEIDSVHKFGLYILTHLSLTIVRHSAEKAIHFSSKTIIVRIIINIKVLILSVFQAVVISYKLKSLPLHTEA